MRYVMKEKLWTWSDTYVIKSDRDEDMFAVVAKTWSFSNQLVFQDMAGREVATIKQVALSWGPKYEIYRDGELAGTVAQKATFFKSKFEIDVPGPDDFTATGNFTDHDFTFERGGRVVATVSKKAFSWSDTYSIDVDDAEDPVIVLAASVVIDLVLSDR